MVRSPFWAAVLISLSLASSGFAQIPGPPASGQNLLERALVLADLYNWADAAPSSSRRNRPSSRLGTRGMLFTRGWDIFGPTSSDSKTLARRFARVRD